MEDVVLMADLDESTRLYVSPVSPQTYHEHVADNALGGSDGYFVLRSRSTGLERLEILAKAPSFEAAEAIFDLVIASLSRRSITP